MSAWLDLWVKHLVCLLNAHTQDQLDGGFLTFVIRLYMYINIFLCHRFYEMNRDKALKCQVVWIKLLQSWLYNCTSRNYRKWDFRYGNHNIHYFGIASPVTNFCSVKETISSSSFSLGLILSCIIMVQHISSSYRNLYCSVNVNIGKFIIKHLSTCKKSILLDSTYLLICVPKKNYVMVKV